MSIAHLLEEFGRAADLASHGVPPALVAPDDIETARLEAFEEGYKAGWDDAVGANASEQLQLSADLSQNLRDLSFTYQEAVSHVTKSLHGVFDGMLTHFLPEVARLSLVPKIAETIQELPLNAETTPLTLAVSTENLRILEKVAAQIDTPEPVEVMEDPDLTAGQVSLRFGKQEVALDFDALLEELRGALEAALPPGFEEVSNVGN